MTGRLVFTRCLAEWIRLRGSFRPCCYDTTPLECTQLSIRKASVLVQLLLNDVKAVNYDTHILALNKQGEQRGNAACATIVHRRTRRRRVLELHRTRNELC